MLHNRLFPQLEGKWHEVNLNMIAFMFPFPRYDTKNWIIRINHDFLQSDYSWGGYLEHRNFLLKDHYNKDAGPDHFWHLGIDFNAPVYSNAFICQ